MKRRVTIRHIFTWNTFSSVCMLLLVEWITHTDADRATFVQPVARLATLEGVVWLPTVVVVLAVDKSVRRCRGRQLMMMLVSVVMVTRCYCATSQRTCTTEQKEAGLVSWEARLWMLRYGSHSFLRFKCKLHHTCLYLVKHSPDGATTDPIVTTAVWLQLTFIDRPQEDETLSWPS